jgi:hypothetical protein
MAVEKPGTAAENQRLYFVLLQLHGFLSVIHKNIFAKFPFLKIVSNTCQGWILLPSTQQKIL